MHNTRKLNLQFYGGADVYTDGDVEDDILSMTKEHTDFSTILKEDLRWAVLYHLTSLRRNLLEWYDFDKDATLLEIGAGCGALTGLFCEKVKTVTAVELSKRRASIIDNRTKQYDNLEIIVGNLNDIQFNQKYDYITLIGVFEYAGRFTQGENPYLEFINKIKQLLKPNGCLIIAIENKFGLKYWNGAREDHTGKLFDSIEGYKEDTGVCTFGKYELQELLKLAGFTNLDFYYPMPDYKIPTQVFSEEFTPYYGQMANFSTPYDQERYQFFDEKAAYCSIIKNKQFGFFANSFLVFANHKNCNTKKIYSNFRRTSDAKFTIQTSIIQSALDKFSIKKSLSPESQEHIADIYENYLLLENQLKNIEHIKVVKCDKITEGIKFDYIEGILLLDEVHNAIVKKDRAAIIKCFDNYIQILNTIYPTKKMTYTSEKSKQIFGNIKIDNVFCTRDANIDLNFDNIIKNNDVFYIIDYEWVVRDAVPLNFIVARNIFNLHSKYFDYLNKIITIEEIFDHFNFSEDELNTYKAMEDSFLKYVYAGSGYQALHAKKINKINTFEQKINLRIAVKYILRKLKHKFLNSIVLYFQSLQDKSTK